MSVKIKICGLSTPETLAAALEAGADFVGLVSFPRSPRHVEPSVAAALATRARGRAKVVCLTVDADDALLERLVNAVQPDYLQLHGRETPERVAGIVRRWGVPAIKAVPVANAADAALAEAYRGIAAFPLFDAKPAAGGGAEKLPGGNGVVFDWSAIAGASAHGPFMLSGGLDAENVGAAIQLTRAPMVDVSSGVESAPGIKDVGKIRAFVRAVRGVEATQRRRD